MMSYSKIEQEYSRKRRSRFYDIFESDKKVKRGIQKFFNWVAKESCHAELALMFSSYAKLPYDNDKSIAPYQFFLEYRASIQNAEWGTPVKLVNFQFHKDLIWIFFACEPVKITRMERKILQAKAWMEYRNLCAADHRKIVRDLKLVAIHGLQAVKLWAGGGV